MADNTDRTALIKLLRSDSELLANAGVSATATLRLADLLIAGGVAPVRNGRWIDNGVPDSMLSGCSVCGFSCGAYSFRYCPNCGARMDGDGNG